MRRCGFFLAGALLAATSSCGFAVRDIAAVPPQPTYSRDIRPILMDHCVLCHGLPSNHGAPTYFRLDRYGDTTVDGKMVQGAGGMSARIAARILKGDMPPAARWGDGVGPHGAAAINRWIEQGLAQ
jgi:hypothetical protein